MLSMLIYVSRVKMTGMDAEAEVARIAARSAERNVAAGVTGALIFTESYFAQLLEGRLWRLDQLFSRLSVDHRHSEIRVLRREPISTRRFSDWSMAYAGRASYCNRFVARYFDDFESRAPERDALALRELMQEFVRTKIRLSAGCHDSQSEEDAEALARLCASIEVPATNRGLS